MHNNTMQRLRKTLEIRGNYVVRSLSGGPTPLLANVSTRQMRAGLLKDGQSREPLLSQHVDADEIRHAASQSW